MCTPNLLKDVHLIVRLVHGVGAFRVLYQRRYEVEKAIHLVHSRHLRTEKQDCSCHSISSLRNLTPALHFAVNACVDSGNERSRNVPAEQVAVYEPW